MERVDGCMTASLVAFSNARVEVKPNTSAHPCPNSTMLHDSPVLVRGIWLPQEQEHSCPKLTYMELSNNHYYLQVGL